MEEIPECETHSYLVDYVNNEQRKTDSWGICTVCGFVDDNHEHKVVDGKCAYCDYTFEYSEVKSLFDYDGVEGNDVFLFAAALPEKFAQEGVVFVSAWENQSTTHSAYDEVASGTNAYPDPLPYKHYYITKGKGEYLLYNVEVEKAGIYEMAIHIRLKDNVDRGAKFLVNEGTENEYYFETSYGWETKEDAFSTRNNEKLIGSYMYGIKIALQEGVNTIKITEASCDKTQHFRSFYFLWVEDLPAEEAPEEPKTLTAEEAIALGNTFEKGKYSDEYYYVTLTLNTNANPNGFARATLDGVDMIISVAGGYLTGDAEGSIAIGDTVKFLAKVGCVNSASTSSTKEARLFEIQSWEIITPAA